MKTYKIMLIAFLCGFVYFSALLMLDNRAGGYHDAITLSERH